MFLRKHFPTIVATVATISCGPKPAVKTDSPLNYVARLDNFSSNLIAVAPGATLDGKVLGRPVDKANPTISVYDFSSEEAVKKCSPTDGSWKIEFSSVQMSAYNETVNSTHYLRIAAGAGFTETGDGKWTDGSQASRVDIKGGGTGCDAVMITNPTLVEINYGSSLSRANDVGDEDPPTLVVDGSLKLRPGKGYKWQKVNDNEKDVYKIVQDGAAKPKGKVTAIDFLCQGGYCPSQNFRIGEVGRSWSLAISPHNAELYQTVLGGATQMIRAKKDSLSVVDGVLTHKDTRSIDNVVFKNSGPEVQLPEFGYGIRAFEIHSKKQ